MWYNANKVLTYNPIMIMTLSARGGGKTYHWKCRVMRRFLKTGKQFVWVRRFKSELLEITKDNSFVSDIIDNELIKHELSISGDYVKIDGKIAGYFVALSQAVKFKSRAFPQVETVVFDEFIIPKNGSHYLDRSKEPELFIDLLSTIFRHRNVRAVLLANAISFNNPYFTYYKIKPIEGGIYFDKNRRIAVEMWDDEDFNKAANQTDISILSNGTKYHDFAFANKFYLDNNDFIEKRPNNTQFLCAVHYGGDFIGFWADAEYRKVYTSYAIDKQARYKIYSLDADDHTPDTIYTPSGRNTHLEIVSFAWRAGLLRFDGQRIKGQALNIVTALA